MRRRRSNSSSSAENSVSMKPVLIGSAVLLLGAVLLRYSIFGFGYGPLVTASDYDKPVNFARLAYTRETVPAAYDFVDHRVIDTPAERAAFLAKHGLPHRSLQQLSHTRLTDGRNEADVIIGDFDTAQAAQRFHPEALVQDTRAIAIISSAPETVNRLRKDYQAHIAEQKRLRIKVAKLRTAGNASFCFFMDLLVGAFFFVLALFLAKYFLIIRQVEQ